MRKIALISCGKKKLSKPALAERLYTSSLFKMSLGYARQMGVDVIYVLSAKHGLVPLKRKLRPYNRTLTTMTHPETNKWLQQVLHQLADVSNPSIDHFIILAGRAYYEKLLPELPQHELPLRGLSLGKRLQFLKRHLRSTEVK